jgi:hypothetical protein
MLRDIGDDKVTSDSLAARRHGILEIEDERVAP